MKIGIMQPYFFPYLGYFQLMNSVDDFVVYDNIQYTKKGWVNRNQILVNGQVKKISIPLKKDSSYLNISERRLSDSWSKECNVLLNKISESYRKAPFFESSISVIEACLFYSDLNLFNFLFNSINQIKHHLGIETNLHISSMIERETGLKGEDRVIAICKVLQAEDYINPIGGMDLYSEEHFAANGIQLAFLKPELLPYKQLDYPFFPSLSIIDVMMFNTRDEIDQMLTNDYKIMEN